MTPIGSAETPFDTRVEAAIARLPELSGRVTRYGLAAAPVASPTHRGVASDGVRLELVDGASVFLKIRHADCADDVAPQAADAARRAAELGVGPEVVCEGDGLLGLAFLGAPWRYAKVGDLKDAGLLAKALQAKKTLHASGSIGHRFDPFARVASLAHEAGRVGAPLPDETDSLVAICALIGEAITASGVDLTFCHNDGVASNVMLEPATGAVRLVDFDLAGDNDPWFDVGALMNEACRFDADRRAALEAYAGACDERVLNRCRLYGALDDVMWGLWGVVRATTSLRSGVEFYKYGTWRLSHARATVAEREFEAWLRRL